MPGARVGQRVSVPLVSSTAGDTHTPDFSAGPVPSTFTVVGIVSAPSQFPPFAANAYFAGPNYYLTPAFYRAHETSVAAFEFSLVRLRPGAAADAAEHQVQALGRGRPVAVQQLGDQARDVNRSIHLVAVALWLTAGLLIVVAVLILGQLLARQIALDATDYPVLRSLGMTRRQLVGLAVVRCTAIGAVGGTLAVVVAIALSPLTPIGLARTAEPTPGLAFDTLVLVIAVVGTTAIAAALALWPAWRAAKAASPALRTGNEDGLGRRSVVADASARAGLPATLTAGVRMALEQGRGPTSGDLRGIDAHRSSARHGRRGGARRKHGSTTRCPSRYHLARQRRERRSATGACAGGRDRRPATRGRQCPSRRWRDRHSSSSRSTRRGPGPLALRDRRRLPAQRRHRRGRSPSRPPVVGCRPELLHPVADNAHRPGQLRTDPKSSTHSRLGAGRDGPTNTGSSPRHFYSPSQTRPCHLEDARIRSGRRGSDRGLAGDDPGGSSAGRRRSPRSGSWQHRLAPFR